MSKVCMLSRIAASKSQTFIAVLLAFVGGIAVASFLATSFPLSMLGIVMGALGIVTVFVWHDPVQRLAVLVGLFFVLGLMRVEMSARMIHDPIRIAGEIGKTVSVRGVVVALPEFRGARADYLLAAHELLRGESWQGTGGRLLLRTSRFPEFTYGDQLVFTCILERPTHERGRLLVRGGAALCEARDLIDRIDTGKADPILGALIELRARFQDRIARALPEPQAGLLAGLLIGERAGLTTDLRTAFQRTGTTHMIAISGFNIAIVTSSLFGLLTLILGRKRAFWITIILLLAFVFVVGAGASVVRAAVMGGIVLLGIYLGRESQMLRLLVIAGALMLFGNPWLLRYDLGFVLSFAATAGLLVFGTPLEKHLRFAPQAYGIRKTLSETGAAMFATLPITMFTFDQVAIIAPLANLAVILIVPTTMALGFFATLVAGIPILGGLLTPIAWALLTAMLGFIEVLSAVPFASFSTSDFDVIGAMVLGAGVLLAGYLAYRSTGRDRSTRRDADS